MMQPARPCGCVFNSPDFQTSGNDSPSIELIESSVCGKLRGTHDQNRVGGPVSALAPWDSQPSGHKTMASCNMGDGGDRASHCSCHLAGSTGSGLPHKETTTFLVPESSGSSSQSPGPQNRAVLIREGPRSRARISDVSVGADLWDRVSQGLPSLLATI